MLTDVSPAFPNTRMQAYYNENDILRGYYIYPVDGCVLHTKNFDKCVIDEETMEETGDILIGYTRSSVMVGYNYDFKTNPFNIYAVPETELPDDGIEIM